MSRVYLSGPMAGLPEHNFPAFHAHAAQLRAAGYDVVNPAEIDNHGKTWEGCLRTDLREMCTCDAIATTPTARITAATTPLCWWPRTEKEHRKSAS